MENSLCLQQQNPVIANILLPVPWPFILFRFHCVLVPQTCLSCHLKSYIPVFKYFLNPKRCIIHVVYPL